MSGGLPFTTPPDPLNSPNEKLEGIRNHLRSRLPLSEYLRSEGIDPGLAVPLGKALDRYEDERDYHIQQMLIEMGLWANTHTHPGGFGPDLSLDYIQLPFHYFTMFNAPDYQSDNGVSWQVTPEDFGTVQGGYKGGVWNGTHFVLPRQHRRIISVISEDLTTKVDTAQVDGTNSSFYLTLHYNPANGRYVAVGGDFSGQTCVGVNDGDPALDADWNHLVIDTNRSRLGDIALHEGIYYSINRHRIYRSNDGTTWDNISATPLTITSTNLMPKMAWVGDLLLVWQSDQTDDGIFASNDNGETWTQVLGSHQGYFARQVREGWTLLPDTLNKILHATKDGVEFQVIEFGADPATGEPVGLSRLAESETLVIRHGPDTYYTADPTGLSGWEKATTPYASSTLSLQ